MKTTWFDIVNEKIYEGMLGVEEIFTDDNFIEWIEKQPDSILNKTMKEIYKLYLKSKKGRK